jgi:hypothetical protein
VLAGRNFVDGGVAGDETGAMPVVTMLFGEIGAGKTTYARRMEPQGAVRLSLDEWAIAAAGDAVHVAVCDFFEVSCCRRGARRPG